MLFSSLVFLFAFLPSILISYYCTPRSGRNYVLLLFSLVFYAWGGLWYSLVLIVSIICNYVIVKQIERHTLQKRRWLIFGLIFNTGLLFVFKYLDFFIQNINWVVTLFNNASITIPEAGIALPLGISFFTFQQMSLLWDVYKDQNQAPAKFIDTALYISLFPQLIAGPIVRYHHIIGQLKNRFESIELINSGIRRFIQGLFKKIIFANSCAAIADSILGNNVDDISTSTAWLAIIAYALQIYFDFSGYSDMAIGLGRMFGFRLLENFNYPYMSLSIQDFWRRWHISLSTWFRDYVYIPFGGNRVSINRTYVNLMIVFLLTGFWHGATWSFVFWGFFHGIFLIFERLGLDNFLRRLPKFIGWSYTILVVLVGWVFFRIENFDEAVNYVVKLFGGGTYVEAYFYHYLDRERIAILFLALVASSSILPGIKKLVLTKIGGNRSLWYILSRDVIYIIMFLYSVLYINSGSYNPFIYFRF